MDEKKLHDMLDWLIRAEIARINLEVMHNEAVPKQGRALSFALMADGVKILHGKERMESFLDELTSGGYTTLVKAAEAGATDAELDMLTRKKGDVQ